LKRLGEIHEFDELVEGTVAAHPDARQVLEAAAGMYRYIDHDGYRIANEFRRGSTARDGVRLNSAERDRVRSWQRWDRCRELVQREDDKEFWASFFLNYADALMEGDDHLFDEYRAGFRLQHLTDLTKLPDCC